MGLPQKPRQCLPLVFFIGVGYQRLLKIKDLGCYLFCTLKMIRYFKCLCLFYVITLLSCNSHKTDNSHQNQRIDKNIGDKVIVDCRYTFEESIAGTKAPNYILKQLQLINVQYYSIDGNVHQGQILTNKKMVQKLQVLFQFMKQMKFPVAHAIPVVKYNWNDDVSMKANNTYSFCYRNPSYSKHALGMAIDINPFFNPLRWKEGYTYRQNKPVGASYNPVVAGTFCASNLVVLEFNKLGLRWGHNFSTKYDDHHFEL